MQWARALPAKSATLLSEVVASYGGIGAVCESSRWLARRMARAITATEHPVVELGAGYGSVTEVLPEGTVSLERDPVRFAHLRATFPDRVIFDSCAIKYVAALERPTVIVSSIPSINNSEFDRLRAVVARAQKAGTVSELITYTYFPHNPFAGIFPVSTRTGLELRNIPPAFVWRYTC